MSLVLDAIERHDPSGIALVGDEVTLTYGQLLSAIEAQAKSLDGVSVLGLSMDNSLEWIVWDLACVRASVICVPIPSFFTQDQVTHLIHEAGISHIVTKNGMKETGAAPSDKIPAGTSKITFTSGSTGTPKGVCLPQSGLEQVAGSIVEAVGKEYAERHMSVLPLTILLENVAGIYSILLTGHACHVYSPSKIGMGTPFLPDIVQMISVMRENRITSAILVPELLNGFMKVLSATKSTLPDLKFLAVGGSKAAPDLVEKSRKAGLPVYEGYGLSECGSVVSLNTPSHDRPGTVGHLLKHVKAEIRDDEIVIHDPAFLGYIGAPRKTEFLTGDLGKIDGDGFVTIHGRRKNIIITSYGRNISPEWVESTLTAQPEILQAFVYGDGQPHLSALVVPFSIKDNLQKSIDRANRNLPDYAQVKEFHAVAPFTAMEGLLSGAGRPKRKAIFEKYKPIIKGKEITDFRERLEYETEVYRAQLYRVPQIMDALRGKVNLESYLAYLQETYHYVSHTVPLLKKMLERIPPEKEWMKPVVLDYIREEDGEENMVLENIGAMGGDKESVRASRPSRETELFCIYNYDYIARKNPIGFIGAIFMLESTSRQLAAQGARAVRETLGADKSAFTYLDTHSGEALPEESYFLQDTLKKITDKADQEAIIEVAQNSFLLFADIMRSIPHEGERRDAGI